MNKILLGFSFVLVGCSQVAVAPKTVHFPYAKELLAEIQSSQSKRAPASAELDASEEKSTRRVYFTSLYHQYLTLGDYLGRQRDVVSCPQFHHDKIATDSYSIPKVSIYKKPQVESEGRDFFPELAFNQKFSLKDYHDELKSEINDLCEEGLSDNFYKFDNLVTHYAGNREFHSRPGAMESVLKIPVFANFYLLKMVASRSGYVFTHPEEKRFIELTQTHWFENYVSVAGQKRHSFIKNKLVKR